MHVLAVTLAPEMADLVDRLRCRMADAGCMVANLQERLKATATHSSTDATPLKRANGGVGLLNFVAVSQMS